MIWKNAITCAFNSMKIIAVDRSTTSRNRAEIKTFLWSIIINDATTARQANM
jgi:hypothetical protein